MSEITVTVEMREERGKNSNRRLRAQGLIPAVVYGGGLDSAAITVNRRSVLDLLRKGDAGENSIFQLTVGKQKRHAMIKEMQVDPTTGVIQHIDFSRIVMTEKLRVQVPVEVVGEAVGVKNDGGILDFMARELEVECLPGDIPDHLEVDVTTLHIGQHLEAKDVPIPEGVELMEDPTKVVLTIASPRVVEEETEEDEDLIEGATDEPKVIGKDEDEG